MTFLLDVNILLTVHVPRHPNYAVVSGWFRRHASEQFATCPITQAGLARLLMQGLPGLVPYTGSEARIALQALGAHPRHVFWPDAQPYLDVADPLFKRIQGFRQITDAYLLGLAIRNNGRLATLDSGIRQLAGTEFAGHVELIQ